MKAQLPTESTAPPESAWPEVHPRATRAPNPMSPPPRKANSQRVRFEIPVAQLGFYDASMEYVVGAGAVDVHVGTSSIDRSLAGRVMVTGGGPVPKSFDGRRFIE